MIAPSRETPAQPPEASTALASARRAVAAILFRPSSVASHAPPRVGGFVAWTFAAGAVAMTVVYFVWQAWWAIVFD